MKKANYINTSNRFLKEEKTLSWKSIVLSVLLSAVVILIINAIKSTVREPSDFSSSISDAKVEALTVEISNEETLVKTTSVKVLDSKEFLKPTQAIISKESHEITEVKQLEEIPELALGVNQEEPASKQLISLSEQELGWVVQLVQHEVGNDPTYFPGYDFDFIQQCMARVILNRLNKPGFPDNIYDVIMQPNQFLDISELAGISPTDETTLKNVMKVLNDEDGISKDLLAEMSYRPGTTPEYALSNMQSQITLEVSAYYSAITVEGRYLLFGEVIF